MTDDQQRRADVFRAIHSQLEREGPGDDDSTRRALRVVQTQIGVRRILDIGCGPGAPTVTLARASGAAVIALDTDAGYLAQLRSRASRANITAVRPVRASMFAVPVRSASVDIVWSEGAIYVMGFERGLREWRDLLTDGGCVAVTHLSWLTPDVPHTPRAFWMREYPAIATVEDNLQIARRCGYDVLDHFALPESAWWNYYTPLEDRLRALRARHGAGTASRGVIDDTQEQIDLYRQFPTVYGYVFFALQARSTA